MRIAIYARKSTESEDRQVQSLEDQLSALRELAKRENLTISEIFIESKSAKAPYQRPEFQRLMGEIEAGRIEGVMTWAINRLSRNPVDGGIIAYHLQSGKLKFIRTIDRTFRPEDNALLLSIENGMATSYLQDLSRNVKRGMRGKAERGWAPGRVPVGYRNNKETHEVENDPTTFHLMRKGWELLLTGGYTLAEVHRELCALGLGTLHKGLTTRHIAKNNLHVAFKNPFYYGVVSYGGQQFPGKHIPMVTKEQFERVQRILGVAGFRKKRTYDHLYSGTMRCGKCGCQIVGETKRKFYPKTNREVQYTYYHCTGAKGCSKKGLAESVITESLEQTIQRFKPNPDLSAWANWALINQADSDGVMLAQSVSKLQDLISLESKRIARLREMRIDGELSSEEFQDLKTATEAKVKALNGQVQDALTESERIQAYVSEKLAVLDQLEGYGDASNGIKRGLILGIGGNHTLTLEKLHFKLDPVLEKIAAFELVRNGSQSPKVGDFLPSNSIWLSLLNDIREVARMQLSQLSESKDAIRLRSCDSLID